VTRRSLAAQVARPATVWSFDVTAAAVWCAIALRTLGEQQGFQTARASTSVRSSEGDDLRGFRHAVARVMACRC
jgi:hypothetical protein